MVDLNSSNAFNVTVESGSVVIRAEGFIIEERQWRRAVNIGELNFVLSPMPISAEVSITRAETRIEDTPASVVALTGEELRTSGAQTLDDKLRQVPGFSLFRRAGSRTANPTTQGVSLRGVGPSGASRALILLDGVPLNDPFGGWIYWGSAPAESISEVEVLRGAASDLYGGSAIGGVVSIETKKPADDATLSAQLSYGTMRTPNAAGYFSKKIGRVRGSLGADVFRTGGFISVAPEDRGPADIPANVRYVTATPEIEYAITSNDRIFASANYYEEKRGNGTPLQFNDTRIRKLVVGGDIDGVGKLSIRGYARSQVYNQSFTAVALGRTSETLLRLQRVPAQAVGFNAVWNTTFRQRFAFFAGIDGRETRGRSDETVFAMSRISSLVSAGGRELTFGSFAGVVFPITSRFVVSGGLRVDNWRNVSGYSATRSLITGQSILTSFSDRSETAFSPRLSILSRVTKNVSLSTSLSTGFRQPTLNELYRSFRVGDVLTLANEDLRAERAFNGEAGVIVSGFDRRLSSRGNIFCTEISRPVANVTLSVAPTLITRQRQNLGRLRSCGVEVDGEVIVSSRFRISGGYLFVDPRVISFAANVEGLFIPQVARHQFSLQMSYTDARVLNASLQLRGSGRQFDDDQNRFQLDKFVTADAYISRRVNRYFSVFVAAENIFDSRIESGRTPLLTLAAPRSVRAGMRIEFSKK